eukprot:TRINITY_DN63234_c0_g1_i1.p1 TRINITY_DN63234_c0_g1~~TRINITY_DN63234_c0_g1_i1.p1  ORF type:complete len:130 (-),score=4.64 TRINITY_DN63234_c0_g1_i1:50-385(-)
MCIRDSFFANPLCFPLGIIHFTTQPRCFPLFIEGQTGDGIQICFQCNEAPHGRPQPFSTDGQNILSQFAVFIMNQVNPGIVLAAFNPGEILAGLNLHTHFWICLLYTSPSP